MTAPEKDPGTEHSFGTARPVGPRTRTASVRELRNKGQARIKGKTRTYRAGQ